MSLQAGARLGPYVITRSLGGGGIGDVFEARDTRLERLVAIKTLRPEFLADDRARRRFEREAKILSSLSHGSICTIFDVGRQDDVDFLVMELIDGEPLSALLDRGPLSEAEAVRIAAPVADALAEAHDRGVLHRDVKPHNVMITRRGGVKVLDFGLAKEITSPDAEAATVSALSEAGTIAGTAPYMSPEQVRGEAIDQRSDVFSFGSVLYEMVAGTSPFLAPTAAETVSGILTRDPVPLARSAPATSPEFQRIVRKCLDKNPSRRYQTLRDVATDLDSIFSGTPPAVPVAKAFGGRSRRRTVVLAAAAALVLALIAAAGALRGGLFRSAPATGAIAILPLKPLSAVTENYLGLGIADGVISRLSRTSALTVRPTSAVRRFADADGTALDAAAALQVDSIMEGSWQREGDRIRVSVNLLRGSDGRSLWTEQFEFPWSELFMVQDRVSDELAARLRVELDSADGVRGPSRTGGTGNADAYEAYLRGQFQLGVRGYTPQDRQPIDKAIDFFERAVALDPGYAEARAKLGFAYAHAAIFVEHNPAWIERAKHETAQAEALRPGMGQTRLTQAMMEWSWYEGWRIVDSIRHYREAAVLDPSLTDIELSAGYAHLGLLDEWRRAGQRVVERDPTNRAARVTFVNEYFLLNRPEEGAAQQKRWLNEDPDHRYFLLTRQVDRAAPLVEANVRKDPDDPWAIGDLALLRALQGRFAEADALVAQLLKFARKNRSYHHNTYTIARVYGLAADGRRAARWLEETIDWGFPCYPVFSTDPFFDRVKDSPEMQRVLTSLHGKWQQYRAALH
jgi:TolB-like protein/tRNA A-37 threonylcarbamoyl transferase component Bud32